MTSYRQAKHVRLYSELLQVDLLGKRLTALDSLHTQRERGGREGESGRKGGGDREGGGKERDRQGRESGRSSEGETD